MRSLTLVALAAVLAACGPSDDDSRRNPNPPIPGTPGGDCGDNAPTIQELTATIGAPRIYETQQSGPTCLSTVTITVMPYDEDGDLDYYLMDVWWDDVIDGRVLPEGPRQRIEGALDGPDCGVFSVQGISMNLGVGGNPPFNTEVEFGVVLEDSAGNRSNDGVPQVVSMVTPGQASQADCN